MFYCFAGYDAAVALQTRQSFVSASSLETDAWAFVVVGLAKAGDGSHCAICIPIINGDGLEMEGR